MTATSLIYYNDQWAKVVPRCLRLEFQITTTVTASPIVANSGTLLTFGAISSQSTIDNFLNTTSEFTIAQFDATAMGNDTVGGIVNLDGQCKTATMMVAECFSATGGSTLVTRAVKAGTLTDSTLETAYAKGSSGNLAFKVDFGNTPDFDGLTSGLIVVKLYWIAK